LKGMIPGIDPELRSEEDDMPALETEKTIHGRFAAAPLRGAIFGKPGFCIFAFFLALYYFTNAGWYNIGDERFMAGTAKEMAVHGRIGFQTDVPPREGYFVKGPDGLCYSKWGLGQSLVEVPFYFLHNLIWGSPQSGQALQATPDPGAIPEVMVIFLCPSMISAFGCCLLFWFGLRLGFSKRVSLLLALIYGLGTMVWPYSKSLMSEATLNVAVLGGVYGATGYAGGRGGRWLAVSGACMGFAFITKIISAVIVPVLVAYVILTLPTRRALRDLLVFFAPPLAAFLFVQFWHNLIRFGTPWQFGYNSGQDVLGFSTPLDVGLWGLFFSPGKSFFLYTPVAILGLLSLRRFFQRRRAEALLFVGIGAVFTLPHALYYGWSGDWAWGPRFLLVIIPYIILPAGPFLETLPGRARVQKALLILLVLVSLGVQVLGIAVHPYSFIQSRHEVVRQLVRMTPQRYATMVAGDEISSFIPRFSHILGNWWLFKHMVFSYDIGSDAPWRGMVEKETSSPTMWVKGNRTIPFWWPVSVPLISPAARAWVYPLGLANLLMILFWGLRVKGLFREDRGQGGRGSSGKGRRPFTGRRDAARGGDS
jgi:hypothetical protein